MMRSLTLGVVVILVVSCAGIDSGSTTSPTRMSTTLSTTTTTTTTTTISATTTSATTSLTTSTTTTPTTTTTMPPPSIAAWDGDGPGEVTISFPKEHHSIDEVVADALDAMGIDVVDDAPVVLEVDLESISYYIDYDQGRCFKGAAVSGPVTLSDTTAEHETLRAVVDGEYPPPPVLVGDCDRPDPADAPFDYAFEPDFVGIAVEWWGEGAAPYLALVLDAEHYVFDARFEAIQALRLMEWDRIPPDATYDVLHAALEFAGRITHMSDETGNARTYRRAVEKLFDEAIGWDIEIPVTGNSSLDVLAIMILLDKLEHMV